MKKLLVLFLLIGTSAIAQTEVETIKKVLADQQECWNKGDIPCFMEGYWKSDSLKFIGKSGIKYGWQNTLDNYIKSYPDKATMGTLTFGLLNIEPVGPDYFVTGTWHLQRKEDTPNGLFTLLWRKIDGEWKIVYDHSS